jgi:flavin-dependent thymidylate synthase
MDTPIDRYVRSYVGDEPRGGLTRDVAFNRRSFSDDQPENPAQGDIHVGLDGIRAELIQDYDDADLQRVCTFAINATRGIDPEDPPDLVDWEEMLQGGLQTALEDFRITFAIYGVSRTGTHQIVRTRQAAFHQQSQRAHYYGDRPSVRMPESFVGKKAKVAARNGVLQYREDQEYSVDQEFEKLAEHAAWFYRLATVADISYQDARFGLLEGTENFILWEGSLREFINVYAYRGCSMFQWEIVAIFRAMRACLVEAHPYLDKYVKISCEKTHGALDGPQTPGAGARAIDNAQGKPIILMAGSPELSHACTYQGWESVDGQCDFPWARDTNRTFRSTHHRIEKGEVNVVKPVESKKAPLRDQMTAAMEPKLNNP